MRFTTNIFFSYKREAFIKCLMQQRCSQRLDGCDLPYILPSSDNMIFLLPQGGYIASASWKLCSISGLQTPSASLSIGLSAESLILSMSSAGLSLPLQLLGSMVMAGFSKPEPGRFKRINLKGGKRSPMNCLVLKN